MTDSQRFQLDQERRQQYDQAKADLSRLRQLAAKHGELLEPIGRSLQSAPEKVQLREGESPASWLWTYSPNGDKLAERQMPTWSEVNEVIAGIRRLIGEVQRLERDLTDRGVLP